MLTRSIETEGKPQAAVALPNGEAVFVSLETSPYGNGKLVRIDPVTNKVVATIKVGAAPTLLAATKTTVYVVNSAGDPDSTGSDWENATVSVVNVASNRVVDTLQTKGSYPTAIEMLPDMTAVYILASNGVVTAIDVESSDVATIKVGKTLDAENIVSNSSSTQVYTTNSKSVVVIDPSDNSFSEFITFRDIEARLGMTFEPRSVMVNEGHLYVASWLGRVIRVGTDGSNATPVEQESDMLPSIPSKIPDGSAIYYSSQGGRDKTLTIDTADNTSRSINTVTNHTPLLALPNSQAIYVPGATSSGTNAVSVITTSDGQVHATVELASNQKGPFGNPAALPNSSAVYLPNSGAKAVYVLGSD